jgi:hypothetical protein
MPRLRIRATWWLRFLLMGIAVAPGVCAAGDLRPPTAADRATMVAKGWVVSRDALGAMLAKAYRPGRAGEAGASGQAAYQSWLLLWQWCELLARDENTEANNFLASHLCLAPGNATPLLLLPGVQAPAMAKAVTAPVLKLLTEDPAARDEALRHLLRADAFPIKSQPLAELVPAPILAQWLADENFSRQFFTNLSPKDYAPGVLRALAQIAQAQPDKFAQYQALAIAIALVYDEQLPPDWPHAQVARAAVPLKDYAPAEWFAFWVQSNEGKGRLLDLRNLDAEQVKFVVDAPLDPAEYAWARANVRYGRGDFAQAYSSIVYDDQRYTAKQYDWTGGNYTLAAIKKAGGICVDQAYFAEVAGKARGLPTLFFTGTGRDGPHAWFGYMEADNHWHLDGGRYENQNFATGQARDPQTWDPLSDHELASLAGHFRTRPNYAASQGDLVLAGLFESRGLAVEAQTALDSAIAVCPANPAAWDAKTAYLERTGAPADALRANHEAAAKQFSNQPDLRAQHLTALADLARAAGDTAAANGYENQIINQNAEGRTDLGVSALAKQLDDLVNRGQLGEAFKKYQQQADSLGKNGGSGFYYEVVQPFVTALLLARQPARAEQAVQLARQKLSPPAGTMLQRELDDLEDLVLAAPKRPAPAAGAQ